MAFAKDNLEPVFTERVEFAFTELFGAEDPLAHWLTNLGRAVNDLLLGNRRLARDLAKAPVDDDASVHSHEVIYDIKAVSADAWELAKFLRESREVPEIAEFIETRMPQKARLDYQRALDAFERSGDHASVKEKAFKDLLASARDQDSHYSKSTTSSSSKRYGVLRKTPRDSPIAASSSAVRPLKISTPRSPPKWTGSFFTQSTVKTWSR